MEELEVRVPLVKTGVTTLWSSGLIDSIESVTSSRKSFSGTTEIVVGVESAPAPATKTNSMLLVFVSVKSGGSVPMVTVPQDAPALEPPDATVTFPLFTPSEE
jgi:hypothetical protein